MAFFLIRANRKVPDDKRQKFYYCSRLEFSTYKHIFMLPSRDNRREFGLASARIRGRLIYLIGPNAEVLGPSLSPLGLVRH